MIAVMMTAIKAPEERPFLGELAMQVLERRWAAHPVGGRHVEQVGVHGEAPRRWA